MTITEKKRMRDLEVLHSLAQLAGMNLLKEIEKFTPPAKVGRYKVKGSEQLSITQMMMLWDMKTGEQLSDYTAAFFLGVPKYKIKSLPLIDFVRLTLYAKQIADEAKEKFESIKIHNKDSRIQMILENVQSPAISIIDRFASRNGIKYRLDSDRSRIERILGINKAADSYSWLDYFNYFKLDYIDADIQNKIAELK